ncbi:spore germination protein [Paenibacillus cremeus]|uniref:Spore germination protein n=1 Tax=Paenibacillus cremeus TaxID=2163881 RepID=A0A559JDG2_9BACL|nr:spore germination protein [Paenibacillus cremeus]
MIVAPIKITGASGDVTFGDVLQIAPKSTSKTNIGAADGSTGDFCVNISVLSFTNTLPI